MKKSLPIFSLLATVLSLQSQSPIITAWDLNTTGDLGNYQYYQTMPSSNLTFVNMTDSSDVQKVCYNSTHVYVKSDGLANYTMGLFVSNPNQPAAKNAAWLPMRAGNEITYLGYE